MKDNFDDFLKSKIKKSNLKMPDNGFSNRIIQNLPERRKNYLDRRFIITVSTVISAVVFILISGFNQFILGFINLLNGLVKFHPINQEFLFVLIIFSIMILSIPYVEFRRRDY
jgi:Domain of unknown function (DUF5056)